MFMGLRSGVHFALSIFVSGEEPAKAAQIAPERKKRKTRLPQEEVDQILSRGAVRTRRAPRAFEALRRQNPSLTPSPEEEKDESKVAMYTTVRAYYESRESGFQAWVGGQVEKLGYVEVDDEALDLRDDLRAWSKKARKEAFERIGFPDSDN